MAISDFPSSIYANFYSTKRKSLKQKNASDSSHKLVSYSSIFASNFLIVVALAILTVSIANAKTAIQKLDAKTDDYETSLRDESEALFTLFRLVE